MKKILTGIFSAIIIFSCAFAAACGGEGGHNDGPAEGEVTYTITVQAQNGRPVEDVRVYAMLDGSRRDLDDTDENGQVVFNLAPDEYSIEIDASRLPAGYTLSQTSYTTAAESQEITITLNTALMSGSAPSNTRYTVGSVMYDYTFTDVESSEEFSLSELLGEKEMIMLNFYYNSCVPCRQEFPLMIEAYNDYADKIAIVVINYQDSSADTLSYKQEHNLPFYVCADSRLATYFGVDAAPTSFIIDRYGMVCMSHRGGVTEADTFRSWFDQYVGADYGA